jgi:hypothetical protein
VARRCFPPVGGDAIRKVFWHAFILACLSAYFGAPCSASAEDWQRLPDGRVVVELKDVRVALPAAGPDTELITFTDRHHIRDKMTLKEVIERPDAARRLFESTDLVFVSLPNLLDRPGLFLGKFPRPEFKSGRAGFAVGKGVLASCQTWAETFSKLAASLTQNNSRFSPDGWAEFKLRDSPLLLAYVRSPSDPTEAYFPGVSCGYFKDCSVSKCLATDLTASYSFSHTIVEQRDWLSLEQRVQGLWKYIFIDL